jgi:hypothetical protein
VVASLAAARSLPRLARSSGASCPHHSRSPCSRRLCTLLAAPLARRPPSRLPRGLLLRPRDKKFPTPSQPIGIRPARTSDRVGGSAAPRSRSPPLRRHGSLASEQRPRAQLSSLALFSSATPLACRRSSRLHRSRGRLTRGCAPSRSRPAPQPGALRVHRSARGCRLTRGCALPSTAPLHRPLAPPPLSRSPHSRLCSAAKFLAPPLLSRSPHSRLAARSTTRPPRSPAGCLAPPPSHLQLRAPLCGCLAHRAPRASTATLAAARSITRPPRSPSASHPPPLTARDRLAQLAAACSIPWPFRSLGASRLHCSRSHHSRP